MSAPKLEKPNKISAIVVRFASLLPERCNHAKAVGFGAILLVSLLPTVLALQILRHRQRIRL